METKSQVTILVTGLVISLVVSFMVPILAPDYETTDYETLYTARQEVQSFTGASMTNKAPWALEGIYTPYESGPVGDHTSPSGWIYGESISAENNPDNSVSAQYVGSYSAIKLDPGQKSSTPLSQTVPVTGTVTDGIKTYYRPFLNPEPGATNNLFKFLDWIGADVDPYEYKTVQVPNWSFTGYRYEFAPLTKISTDGTTIAAADARLSVVWYNEYMNEYGSGSEGLSGGLVLMNARTSAILAHITIDEIVSAYNVSSQYSTSYRVDFDGVQLDYNIRFDPEALAAGNKTLDRMFSDGDWSMAVTAISAGNFIDIENSTSLSTSLGSVIDTYVQIFTLDLPNVPTLWSIVLWIICIVPVEIAVLMFLAEINKYAAAAAVIGSVLLGGVL